MAAAFALTPMSKSILSRLSPDPYLLALAAMVAVAIVLPARGTGAVIASWAVAAAIFLLFFLYGVRLAPRAVVESIAHWRLQSMILISTFVLFPIVGLALTAALHPWLAPQLALGLMFVCVLPSTVQSSIAFTSIARGNVPAALCGASVSNIFGMLITPALVMLLLSARGSGFSAKALEDIALQLLLPFCLGQLARPWLAGIVARHKVLTSYVDRGSILIIVYAAFSASVVQGVWAHMDYGTLVLIVVLDTLMLGLVLAITTLASRRLGFSEEDEIAIVFCGSKKSMANGLAMAGILFPGQAIGAIVLPLMIFHQIQLFVCAALAQRYARRRVEGTAKPIVGPLAKVAGA